MKYTKSTIYIKELEREAFLYIGVPDDYEYSNERYPVLYMHDGHNVFNKEDSYIGVTWELIESYEKDLNLPKIIVVGLSCAEGYNRFDEYCPFIAKEDMFNDVDRIVGGRGNTYLDYLSNVLKPQIDKNYRTLGDYRNTAIMGSSMGGLISLYAGLKYNNVFSRIGAVSGSYFVAQEDIEQSIREADLSKIYKLYMDVGTNESGIGEENTYVESNQRVYNELCKKLDSEKLRFHIVNGAIHNEADWAKRLPEILKYLFEDIKR